MRESRTYSVPEVHCDHCRAAIVAAVSVLRGVDEVQVDLESKRVTVRGSSFDDGAVRVAIDEAGYEVA